MGITYNYPLNRAYNETEATVNGKTYTVCVQYAQVNPQEKLNHADDCELKTSKSCCAQCTCGALEAALADIDVAALLADARENGKFGFPPVAPRPPVTKSVVRHESTEDWTNRTGCGQDEIEIYGR